MTSEPSLSEEGSLAELFARDPFSFNNQDIRRIVQYYREAANSFKLGGKAPPTKVNLAELGMDSAPRTITMDQFKRSGK